MYKNENVEDCISDSFLTLPKRVTTPMMRTSQATVVIKLFDSLSKSVIFSAKPTTYIDTATALANEKINPIAPPNLGPSERDIKKYAPPPRTFPFVQIADIEMVVIVVKKRMKM